MRLSIGAVIMASGFSKRFGQENKLLLPLGDSTVIGQTTDAVLEAGVFDEIVLVTQYEALAEQFDSNITVVMNRTPESGVSSSVRLGVGKLPTVDGYMFVPGDQVLLTGATIVHLVDEFCRYPNKIVVPVYDGIIGSPKIFPASLKGALLSLQGDEGGRQLLKRYGQLVHKTAIADPRENLDIDTYETYVSIREGLG